MSWTPQISSDDVVAIHAVLVPSANGDGEILLFGGDDHDFAANHAGQYDHSRRFNCRQPTQPLIYVHSPAFDLFCCGHAQLPNGRVLVAGGTDTFPADSPGPHREHTHFTGHRHTTIYDPTIGAFVPASDMNPAPGQGNAGGGRWYPTLCTLASGEVLAFQGHPEGDDTRHNNNTPERYQSLTNSWVLLPAVGEDRDPILYPRVHLLRDGTLFVSSSIPSYTQNITLDPNSGAVQQVSSLPDGAYAGYNCPSVLLPLVPADGYQPRVLLCGGLVSQLIDLGQPSPSWANVPRNGGTAGLRRNHACATLLPTGDILMTGGTSDDIIIDQTGVFAPELYSTPLDRATGTYTGGVGQWQTINDPASVLRNYHSTALLMPDGRVWTAGGNSRYQPNQPPTPAQKQIEIYDPPYPVGPRPTIDSCPAAVPYNQAFVVGTTQAGQIESVVLMRCGTSTHAFNPDQRMVYLQSHHSGANALTVTSPPNGAVAPPGNYMLFIVDNQGRPCNYARFVRVALAHCTFVINRSTLGQDEIDARRKQPRNTPGGLPVPDAFRVAVDGFTAAELGITGPGSTLTVASPITGMTINCTGNFSDNGDYGTEVQRFTFLYNIDFPDDSAFSFASQTQYLTLNVTAGRVPASAQIELIKQPDPFILHGDPAWLSIDLRVFVVRANQTRFGVPMGNDASAAPAFIQQVLNTLNQPNSTVRGEFDNLPTDESAKLFVYPTDNNGTKVFNFALAKVHYIGLIGATDVRVFFRLFPAQTTFGAFDYPPGAQYRRAPSNPPEKPQPIPLAGFQGNEYVTIPCFAAARIDTTARDMGQQTDDFNVLKFTANADGSEVDRFYGCWLDINQPTKLDPAGNTVPNNVLPRQVPATKVDGPFTDPSNPPLTIQQAILKNLHQCLIAEIAFDPVVIPIGKDPSNWDKLAQRNLAWSDVGSAQALTTFEIRPTPSSLPASQTPDELMIDWQNVPSGSTAQIYLPTVNAADVLAMAARLYTSQRLTRVDDHTLQCKTGGITYVPIPPGGDINYAGLLSVDVPATVRRGEVFDVVVRQVTNAFSRQAPPPPPPPQIAAPRPVTPAVALPPEIEWRRVLGAFQLTIPVKTKEALLLTEERELSVLRWIAEAIPRHNRWYLVFGRYLEQIAGRVRTFGGDPTQILPSPTGEGIPKHRRPEKHEPRVASTGKIAGLIFDRFGDFEGFLLDTEDGERKFFSREKELEALAERAWRERLRITVWAERDEPYRPLSIIVREPPAPFGH